MTATNLLICFFVFFCRIEADAGPSAKYKVGEENVNMHNPNLRLPSDIPGNSHQSASTTPSTMSTLEWIGMDDRDGFMEGKGQNSVFLDSEKYTSYGKDQPRKPNQAHSAKKNKRYISLIKRKQSSQTKASEIESLDWDGLSEIYKNCSLRSDLSKGSDLLGSEIEHIRYNSVSRPRGSPIDPLESRDGQSSHPNMTITSATSAFTEEDDFTYDAAFDENGQDLYTAVISREPEGPANQSLQTDKFSQMPSGFGVAPNTTYDMTYDENHQHLPTEVVAKFSELLQTSGVSPACNASEPKSLHPQPVIVYDDCGYAEQEPTEGRLGVQLKLPDIASICSQVKPCVIPPPPDFTYDDLEDVPPVADTVTIPDVPASPDLTYDDLDADEEEQISPSSKSVAFQLPNHVNIASRAVTEMKAATAEDLSDGNLYTTITPKNPDLLFSSTSETPFQENTCAGVLEPTLEIMYDMTENDTRSPTSEAKLQFDTESRLSAALQTSQGDTLGDVLHYDMADSDKTQPGVSNTQFNTAPQLLADLQTSQRGTLEDGILYDMADSDDSQQERPNTLDSTAFRSRLETNAWPKRQSDSSRWSTSTFKTGWAVELTSVTSIRM